MQIIALQPAKSLAPRSFSWSVVMEFASCHASRVNHLIPSVNGEPERSAWGVFSTECFPTYDFLSVQERIKERVENGGQ